MRPMDTQYSVKWQKTDAGMPKLESVRALLLSLGFKPVRGSESTTTGYLVVSGFGSLEPARIEALGAETATVEVIPSEDG